MNKSFSKGLFIFSNDLRLHDQAALRQASLFCERLVCIFCIDEQWSIETYFGSRPMGSHRHQFLLQSLRQLDQQLVDLGHKLHIYQGNSLQIIEGLVSKTAIDAVFSSFQAGLTESTQWQYLKTRLTHCHFQTTETHSLFYQSQHQWSKKTFPESFNEFKDRMEQQIVDPPIATITELPPPFPVLAPDVQVNLNTNGPTLAINGGELAGLKILQQLLDRYQKHPDDCINNTVLENRDSTALSPWLANGSVSVKTVFSRIDQLQKTKALLDPRIQSLQIKLLRREYFQWYAVHHASRIFTAQGVSQQHPLTSVYPQRFKQWCYGNTPWQIVNAYMNQLRNTGMLSNRGRMVVASCLTNELQVDWRWGAAYFQQQLIDYDVAINWSSWQEIAGVSDKSSNKMHIDLSEKRLNDMDKRIQDKWSDKPAFYSIDHVDAADWPISE